MVDGVANLSRERDTPLRTLTGISIAHWVSHFYILVLPMLFPFLKEQLGVGFVELGFAITVFAVVSGLAAFRHELTLCGRSSNEAISS